MICQSNFNRVKHEHAYPDASKLGFMTIVLGYNSFWQRIFTPKWRNSPNIRVNVQQTLCQVKSHLQWLFYTSEA